MNVLLSIRPKYVEEIIKGNKRYEFRKSIFKKNVEEVWIYATSPTKKKMLAHFQLVSFYI